MTTSKENANERLSATSAMREIEYKKSLIRVRESGEKRTRKKAVPAEYQKAIRDAQAEKLKELHIARAHPFISKDFVEKVSGLATKASVSRPVAIGAVVSAFLSQDREDQLIILDEHRPNSVDTSSVFLPKDEVGDESLYSLHNKRQKLKGKVRKMIYLPEDDLESLNNLRSEAKYSNQGFLVEAILQDFFARKPAKKRLEAIKEHSVEI